MEIGELILGLLGWVFIIWIGRKIYKKSKKEINVLSENRRKQLEKKREEFYEKEMIKRKSLINRYGEQVGRKLFKGEIWVGMTEDQVIESVGKPNSKEQTSTKSIKTEKWFYTKGKNRLGNPITYLEIKIENGTVTRYKELEKRDVKYCFDLQSLIDSDKNIRDSLYSLHELSNDVRKSLNKYNEFDEYFIKDKH